MRLPDSSSLLFSSLLFSFAFRLLSPLFSLTHIFNMRHVLTLDTTERTARLLPHHQTAHLHPDRPGTYPSSLPSAIAPSDTVPQDKLERHEYPTLSIVESDIKRMVANAKQYNDDKSTIYQDAERIRKALSNFMTKHNPAYRDPNYVAIPTPIPGDKDDASASSAPPTREPSEQPKKIKISLKASRDRKSSVAPPAASSPAPVHDDSDPNDFTGKTFQQAQEHIINGLISYTDQGSVTSGMLPPHTANFQTGSKSSSPSSRFLLEH
jgi:hypothetical protein